ncbi:MAG TPA: hypothetical protein VG323_02375 [Thermoanaerobaculia bacterium]|nr:hypothetical protein [Thermoanaerobaculia bacterium]
MIQLDHIHLAINHSPLYAETFAFFFLLIGTLRKNRTLVTSGLVIAIIAALCGWAADWTGNGAAEILTKANPPIPGVDVKAIDLHDLAATFLVTSASITGVVAIIALKWRRRWLEIVLIVLSLWTVSVAVRVALLGGRIHHPEVRAVVKG